MYTFVFVVFNPQSYSFDTRLSYRDIQSTVFQIVNNVHNWAVTTTKTNVYTILNSYWFTSTDLILIRSSVCNFFPMFLTTSHVFSLKIYLKIFICRTQIFPTLVQSDIFSNWRLWYLAFWWQLPNHFTVFPFDVSFAEFVKYAVCICQTFSGDYNQLDPQKISFYFIIWTVIDNFTTGQLVSHKVW